MIGIVNVDVLITTVFGRLNELTIVLPPLTYPPDIVPPVIVPPVTVTPWMVTPVAVALYIVVNPETAVHPVTVAFVSTEPTVLPAVTVPPVALTNELIVSIFSIRYEPFVNTGGVVP